MFRTLSLSLTVIVLGGCHGWLGGRTTEEDQEINEFAEARQRAGTYYEGRDYSRAAAQFKKALDLRPDHFTTKLGYAYSLMYTKEPVNLVEAENQFKEMGVRSDKTEEVKRIYGLALTHRTLATRYEGQARYHDRKGMLDWRDKDIYNARKHAREGIKQFNKVLDIDTALSKAQDVAPLRVSASLTPDAHAGIANCEIILADRDHPNHLKRAIEHIEAFAKVAAQARNFWEKQAEKVIMVDPVLEGSRGVANSNTLRGKEREMYARRIASTIDQEAKMREALIEIYIEMEQPIEIIGQCDTLLDLLKLYGLEERYDRVYWNRGQAYASLRPPNFKAALDDLEEYRKLHFLDQRLTDDLVRLNRWIKKYREGLESQEARGEAPAAKVGSR
ncbi:MAG: hypothetical protein ACYTGN_15385 [Planctomycetota bacterium]